MASRWTEPAAAPPQASLPDRFHQSPWSLRGAAPDAWLLMAAYLAYCTAAAAAFARVGGRGERALPGTAAGLPVLAGYLLGTVGVLGLAFVAGDYGPRSDRAVIARLSYRTYGFGDATTTAGGTVVEVFAHPRWAPFLERSLFRRAYDYREHDLARIAVEAERAGTEARVVVREGGRVLDRVGGE